ncbi:MAG: NFACT RNA binding domain-containing protein [Spirochaetaceae bacterium]|nr:NFACT RNA binding domain-containing protein [Spirochaetaceae bacterium]
MSLNCVEIDRILQEAPLAHCKIQEVFQPSFDTLVLELYGEGRRLPYLLSIAHGACRLHPLTSLPPRNERPLRFMECLRAHIRGGTVLEAVQHGMDRIVEISIARRAEDGSLTRLSLVSRLWSGPSGNILLVSEDGTIIDALRRIPAKGEISGAHFDLNSMRAMQPSDRAAGYQLRAIPQDGPFWKAIEREYAERTGALSLQSLLEQAEIQYQKRKSMLAARLEALHRLKDEYTSAERWKELGDILLAGYEPIPQGRHHYAKAYDFYRDEEILIEIDANKPPAENATRYYEKYHKAKSGLGDVIQEITRCERSLAQLETWIAQLRSSTEPLTVAKALRKAGTMRAREKPRYPCLALELQGWTILIGRNATENDELLRHVVKGSDVWLHARDYQGAYVFIRARRGKSVPPEILVAGAKLAVYYSKGRKNLGGNVHHTFVKYLRRAQQGPKGLVIPYHEKNLYISFRESEIRELLSESGEDTT